MGSRIKMADPNDNRLETVGSISSPDNETIMEANQNGKLEVVELDEATFSRLSPNINHACRELNCKLKELAQSGRIAPKSCETMQRSLCLLSYGERCLIPQLIDENLAARILDMDANALRESKYLRQFRYGTEVFYLNTEIYELLDKKEHCPRRAANNPACKNKKDRASVRARKTFTDAVIRGTAHELSAKESMCMSIYPLVQEFVRQGQYSAESRIRPREIYDILQSFTHGGGALVENLAFLCSKFGCKDERDLAYLLEAEEDEIHALASRANIKIEALAQYWERL